MLGPDISLKNQERWSNLKKYIRTIEEQFNLSESIYIKSNFREIFHEPNINKNVIPGYSWYINFHMSIGVTSHAAPLHYKNNFKKVLLSSGFAHPGSITSNTKEIVNSARWIDNREFINIIPEQVTRQDKLKDIVHFCNSNNFYFKLRVCLQKGTGFNCRHCEKCCKTILGLLAENAEPNMYGFSVNDEDISNCIKFIDKSSLSKDANIEWLEIQERVLSRKLNLYKYYLLKDILKYDIIERIIKGRTLKLQKELVLLKKKLQ